MLLHTFQTYQWDNTSVILSSFIWGYVCLQVLAGYLGSIYGPKYFLFSAFAINSVAFILIPFAANILGSIGVMLCRVVQGKHINTNKKCSLNSLVLQDLLKVLYFRQLITF